MTESDGSLPARILICSGVRGDTRRYRAVHLWEQAVLLGYASTLVHLTDPRLEQYVSRGWDVVVLHRVALDGYVERLIARARIGGALLLYDIDDLVFAPEAFHDIDSPDFADPMRAALYRETMARFRAGLLACDAVLASTDFLAERAVELGKPVWVHRNAASLEMLKVSNAALSARQIKGTVDPVVIGYASGTLTHNRDFAQVKPALLAVMARHPEVRLRLIGPLDAGDDWGALSQRVERRAAVPWRALPELLAQFDINLAPLVLDNPFAKSKSEIKFMEAALVGVPTVASPTGAFRSAIQAGENGFLAANGLEWETALEQMLTNPVLREAIGTAAREGVVRDYHPVRRALDLQNVLVEITTALRNNPLQSVPAGSAAARAEIFLDQKEWVAKPWERDPSNRQLGLYSLRHRSIKTLAMQVWIYFRRLLAPVFPFRKVNE